MEQFLNTITQYLGKKKICKLDDFKKGLNSFGEQMIVMGNETLKNSICKILDLKGISG